jgi:hypothetical protein
VAEKLFFHKLFIVVMIFMSKVFFVIVLIPVIGNCSSLLFDTIALRFTTITGRIMVIEALDIWSRYLGADDAVHVVRLGHDGLKLM